jgi:DNA-binding LytR/AlgR family response regulator
VSAGLSILAVDDERPGLDELCYLLSACELAASVVAVPSATDALRRLQDRAFDLLLLDIRMPGLDGLELARVLDRFAHRPAVVFVTAHEEHALDAFDVGAIGYLLKPLDKERLDRVLQRVVAEQRAGGGSTADDPDDDLDVLPIEVGGRTRIVARSDVRYVEAAGDYVRVHLRDRSRHLVRMSMTALEQQWTEHGFARIHRSYLVALREIRELRTDAAGTSVMIDGRAIPVSRRHLRELRDRLVRHVRPPVR